MKLLWAPWRIQYIAGEREKGCFLCRIRREKKKDVENLVLWRGKTHFVVMNLYPYNNGHLMVASNRHVALLDSLSDEELLELMQLTVKCVQVLKKALRAQGVNAGFNLGLSAGAGLEDHLHFHIVPRWQGDTNFMPVLTDTKVISQQLQQTYEALKKAW